MTRIAILRAAVLGCALASLGPVPRAFAQSTVLATPNADRLAEEIRALTADPRNLRALLSAGDLSNKLNDPAAALAFFARAEKIDPDNPRLLSGRASALVRQERPGEALLLFAQAESKGVPASSFAADRGLAYDLLGAQPLAQREYETALASERDDETLRRYALSLGISGEVTRSMALLEPLLRDSDRAAWRARAFVLAMNGETAAADRIALSMMPGKLGQALSPFFRRLPGLSPADRAFAVHFGELGPSPERIADARMAPPLPGQPPRGALASAPPPTRPRADTTLAAMGREPDLQPRVAPVPAAPARTPASSAREPARPRADTTLATMGREPERAPPPAAAARPEPAPVVAAAAEPAPPGPPGIGEEDSVLAAIVDKLTIPGPELAEVALEPLPPPRRVAPAPKPAPVVAKPPAKPVVAKPAVATKPKPKAPPKPDPAKAEPKRFWVQLGIGQNVKALPFTWKTVVKKAPAAMKGKQAWMTPLNATNRLLTGPFPSAGAAQAFVNLLKKQGVSSYSWTSPMGQKVSKLPGQ